MVLFKCLHFLPLPLSSQPSLICNEGVCVFVYVCLSVCQQVYMYIKTAVKLYIKRLISSLDVVIWSVCVCACVRALLLPVYQWGHISTDDLGWRANLAGSGSRCSPQHFHTTRQAGKWSSPVSVREQRKTVKPCSHRWSFYNCVKKRSRDARLCCYKNESKELTVFSQV